mgnify:CR=1 FL=1
MRAAEIFAAATDRYQAPKPDWLETMRRDLQAAVDGVDRAFAEQPGPDAEYWKSHLRWDQLKRNLRPDASPDLGELEEVRRWAFSNRRGIESPVFAPLRAAIGPYLDAAYATLHPNLAGAFREHVALARRQCEALATDPCDARAAELGRTLGWFERTGQLAPEVATVRSLVSLPNAQIVVASDLVRRIVAVKATSLTETIVLRELVTIPPSGALQRSRQMQIRGSAAMNGNVSIVAEPNDAVAELALKYEGTVESTARGVTGPVTIRLDATGTAQAVKPIYFGPDGLDLGEADVAPQVKAKIADVAAERQFVERIARRRIEQPDSRALMDQKARSTTVEQLSQRVNDLVDKAIDEIRAEIEHIRTSLGQLGEVTAPLVREGVALAFDGTRSSSTELTMNCSCRGREQHGAAAPCPDQGPAGDIVLRFHVSFVSNMAETITGGKTLSDEFFMQYAKILHAQLPTPLMVHSRAPRWSFTMAKHRPIELQNPGVNEFAFVVRLDAVEIAGRTHSGRTTARIPYRLVRDAYGDHSLERIGEIELDSPHVTDVREFEREKIAAFFGPVLDAGGVIVPDGGLMSVLKDVSFKGVHAEREWIVAAWEIPNPLVDQFLNTREPAEPPGVASPDVEQE